MKFKQEAKRSALNGFLDSGSSTQGELRFETSFRVDGRFQGKVSSDGDLVVGESGEVEGDLKVGALYVTGVVRGTVQASRRVQIAPGGKLFAELETPTLVIEDGALFEGRCAMQREAAPVPKLVPVGRERQEAV